MAKAHEEMAKCLNSNKSMNECHNQMMKGCPMYADMKSERGGMMCENCMEMMKKKKKSKNK